MGMINVAAVIWNEIARNEQLATAWAKKVFPLSDAEILEEQNREYEELMQRWPHEVSSSFLNVKPLLLENVAISRHIVRTGRLDLRNALPEIVSIHEAVSLASGDCWLEEDEEEQLRQLLQETVDAA